MEERRLQLPPEPKRQKPIVWDLALEPTKRHLSLPDSSGTSLQPISTHAKLALSGPAGSFDPISAGELLHAIYSTRLPVTLYMTLKELAIELGAIVRNSYAIQIERAIRGSVPQWQMKESDYHDLANSGV